MNNSNKRLIRFDWAIKTILRNKNKESEVKPGSKAQGLEEAAKKLAILNLSDEERRRYELHIGDARDAQSNIQTAFMDGKFEGKAEGKAEGKTEERKKLITSMHRSGLPISQMSQMLEIDEKQIQEIIESI